MLDSRYRPDIDGLRAIAVLSVIFYHLGLGSVPGGFVGVDVFFVISGYLITRLIMDQIDGDNFRLSNFYIRRVRRLFPALFVTLLATLIAAAWIFPPDELVRTAGALIHSIASISNFYFLGEANYFDSEAIMKPVLHTWSLSVEEQFYFVWPTTLLLLMRWGSRQWVLITIIVIGLLSLYVAQLRLEHHPSQVFYMAPYRAFEFSLGAIVIWAARFFAARPNWIDELLLPAGLLLIGYSVFFFDDETLFPGLNALIPCIGSALVIFSGQAPITGKLISNKFAVGIGLISYSLYLIHWPAFVFYSYYKFAPLDVYDHLMILGFTFASALAMYRYVEQPLRKGKWGNWSPSPAGFGWTCAALALLFTIPLSTAWLKGGWSWRTSGYVQEVLMRPADNRGEAIRLNTCHFRSGTSIPDVDDICLEGDYLILGPSTAADLYGVFSRAFENNEFAQITAQACLPGPSRKPYCHALYRYLTRSIDKVCSMKAILIHTPADGSNKIKPLLKLLNRCDSDIYFLGGWNGLDYRVKDIAFRFQQLISNRDEFNTIVSRFYLDDERKAHYQYYVESFADTGVQVMRMDRLFNACNQGSIFIDDNNRIFMQDTHHLQVAAMDFYGECLEDRFGNMDEFLTSGEFRG